MEWRWLFNFIPVNIPRHLLYRRLGGPQRIWTLWTERFLASAGNRIPAVLPIARHYTSWAMPATLTEAVSCECRKWVLASITLDLWVA
jgi:hypothetical protein